MNGTDMLPSQAVEAEKKQIAVSIGKRTQPQCAISGMPREEIETRLLGCKVGPKSEKWFAAAEFQDCYRSAENIQTRQDFTFDIDCGYSEEEIRATVKASGYRVVIYSTYSHGIKETTVSIADFDQWKQLSRPSNPAESYLTERKGLIPRVAANPDGHSKSPTFGHLKIPHLAAQVFR